MKSLPLLDVTSGAVRIAAFEADAAEERRLGQLGLQVGARLEVVQHRGQGGLMVAVGKDGRSP